MVVLDKICGEANKTTFVGFTDLFQSIFNQLCPDYFPFNIVQDTFNAAFDKLQEQMKPVAYAQGAAMGTNIENQVNAWIKSKTDAALAEIKKVRDQAMNEIAEAERLLIEHTAKLQNLSERLTQLEGQRKSFWPFS